MSKITPAVSRMAAILELFARDPSRPWTLSEIVAEVGISRSTCHALLTSLDLANFVYRDEAKRYMLGSLTLEIGRAAVEHFSPAEFVSRELAQLSREWGAITITNYRRQDAILIRDWIDPHSSERDSSQAGALIPLAPPWGAIFYAWEAQNEQRRWLTKMPDPYWPPLQLKIADGLRDIREQGFMCGVRTEDLASNHGNMHWHRELHYIDHFAGVLDPAEDYTVNFLAAPVFGTHGRIAFAVSVTGFDAALKGDEVLALASHLKSRCRKLEKFLLSSSNVENTARS